MTRVNATERFQVERTLGRGGMGTVHQAYDNARGTMVALKMLHRLDPTSLLRFKTEFRALANLSHPNLVQLFELVQRDEDYLLSMELVDGPDFLGYVRSIGESASEVEAGGDTSSIPGTPATGIRPSQPEDNQTPRQVAQLDEQKLIEPLTPQDAERLARARLTGSAHAERLVQEVVNEACGSPFFIRELAAFVRSQSPEAKLELKLAVVLEARVAALPTTAGSCSNSWPRRDARSRRRC